MALTLRMMPGDTEMIAIAFHDPASTPPYRPTPPDSGTAPALRVIAEDQDVSAGWTASLTAAAFAAAQAWDYEAQWTAPPGFSGRATIQVVVEINGNTYYPTLAVVEVGNDPVAVVDALITAGVLQVVAGASSSSGQTGPELQFTALALANAPSGGESVSITTENTVIRSS